MQVRRALFLDRDGIVNLDLGYVHRREDFVFREGIVPLCAEAQALGMALVIVTNQAGIGRGLYTETDFHALTEWMLGVFAADGIHFTAVEYCPDHPVHGIGRYRRENPRRKPGPGMMRDAAHAHGLDLAASVMIGDRATDMLAAAAAGIPTRILLPADAAEAASPPSGTIVVADGGLPAAARHLAQGHGA
jgi:D-glycero-D-manno-heptose 1,7-bisphosphate phosphatase